jgi:hypothetical protein
MSIKVLTTADAVNASLDAPALDPILLSVANDYLAGKSISTIADSYSISQDRVTAILEKRDVKSYVDRVYASQGFLNRVKRMDLINRVIEQKMADAMETGQWSKRDLLDWLKLLNEMEATTLPKQNGPAVAVQINNYDRLMKDLIDG